MIRFSTAMIVLHILQIILWAAFYRWRCLSTWESNFYFSSATYSTVGNGDIVLPGSWRLLGPVEGITGVLHVRPYRELYVRDCGSNDGRRIRKQSDRVRN